MPFIAGESLRHSLEAGRRFGVSETIEYSAMWPTHRVCGTGRHRPSRHQAGEYPARRDNAVITDFGVAKSRELAMGLDSRSSWQPRPEWP